MTHFVNVTALAAMDVERIADWCAEWGEAAQKIWRTPDGILMATIYEMIGGQYVVHEDPAGALTPSTIDVRVPAEREVTFPLIIGDNAGITAE